MTFEEVDETFIKRFAIISTTMLEVKVTYPYLKILNIPISISLKLH